MLVRIERRETKRNETTRRMTSRRRGAGRREESPSDLRYETLIKIISSASVGCRDAYTTASRECSDLNGNNSVKDGCSRPCTALVAVSDAARCRCCFSYRAGQKKRRKKSAVVRARRAESRTGDIVIWARIPASNGDCNSEDKNVGYAGKNSRETREPEIETRREGCREPVAIHVPA